MKSITIDDKTFQYELIWNHQYYTCFYSGTMLKKKYGFFGKKIEVPKLAFTLGYSIEDAHYSKEKIRQDIMDAIKFLNRKEEIERGEII